MKKILFLTVIAFCASFSVKAQDIVNLRMDRQQLGLRGYVATMDEDILIRKDYFREDWPERKWFVKDLRNVLSEDPQALASALSAPVKVERHAIHPVENFGSAMSPLYTTLALWIGALLTMVMLKV